MLGIEMLLFFFPFSFPFSLVDRRSMKEGRVGGWHFGEERGKGGRLNTIEGGGTSCLFFPALAYLAYKRQNCMVSWF